MIRSYDVFDTLITRSLHEPKDLFLLLGRELVEKGIVKSKEEFFELRVNSESVARLASAHEEITLNEIYGQMRKTSGWSDNLLDDIAKREHKLEQVYARPIVQNIRELKTTQQNDTSALISDIYFDKNSVEQIIAPFVDGSKSVLFVSSEHRVTKHSGRLYNVVAEKLDRKNQSWEHLGDNLKSDVISANQHKVTGRHFIGSTPTRYENSVANLDPSLRLELSLYAGAMKAARLSECYDNSHQQAIWQVATNVLGPVLFNYVKWILHHAQQKGIERLYFVSRDGQILNRIAQSICEHQPEQVFPECRYLYGSRQAWHIPAIVEIGERELDWLFDPTELLSVESVCARVNLSPNEIILPLEKGGFVQQHWNLNLDTQARSSLRLLFANDANIQKAVLDEAAACRELTRGYLEQEGLFEGKRIAMVDIGWSGRLQSSLSKVLDICGVRPVHGVHGYYFGLRRRARIYPDDEMFCYFKDPDICLATDRLCDYPALYEIFVAADHGSVVAYRNVNGFYNPVMRQSDNKELIEWGLLVQQQGIMAFVREVLQNSDAKMCNVLPEKMISTNLLTSFLIQPDEQEALCYGQVRIYEDQTENIGYELAPRLKFSQVFASVISNRKKVHQNLWLEAAIARQRKPLNKLLTIVMQIKHKLQKPRTR